VIDNQSPHHHLPNSPKRVPEIIVFDACWAVGSKMNHSHLSTTDLVVDKLCLVFPTDKKPLTFLIKLRRIGDILCGLFSQRGDDGDSQQKAEEIELSEQDLAVLKRVLSFGSDDEVGRGRKANRLKLIVLALIAIGGLEVVIYRRFYRRRVKRSDDLPLALH
jgi:hypothetical protein